MTNIDEQELRNYLLGGLTPERQAILESLAQADENLREELLAIEEELVDQYLAGALSADESQSFENRVLTTERGQQKLHFAELFNRYRNSNPAEEPLAEHRVPAPHTPPPARTTSPLFVTFLRNPTFAVLAIFVAALLIVLGGWLLVAPSSNMSIAEERSKPEVIFPLTPDSTRPGGSMNHLPAPAKNVQIKLELELAKSDFKKYKIKLFRENEPIDSQEELQMISRDAHYFIPVVVTADILTPGDYRLKLCGVLDSGEPSFIDNYPFRVTVQDQNEADQRDNLAR